MHNNDVILENSMKKSTRIRFTTMILIVILVVITVLTSCSSPNIQYNFKLPIVTELLQNEMFDK